MSNRSITITASMLRSYKRCPRRFELEYVQNLKPVQTADALAIGSSYHNHVEKILRGESREASVDLPGIMADAFARFLPYQEWRVVETEKEFRLRLAYGCWMVGKIDAVCADGTPVEHKTTSESLDEKYVEKLAWDDQVSFYLLALSHMRGEMTTRVVYTACQKPTIRQKQSETAEEFLERVRGWYDETRVRTFTVVRTREELEEKAGEIRDIAREIRQRKRWYRNPSDCAIMGCPYRSICLDYDPECLMGFVRKERRNEELCKF